MTPSIYTQRRNRFYSSRHLLNVNNESRREWWF